LIHRIVVDRFMASHESRLIEDSPRSAAPPVKPTAVPATDFDEATIRFAGDLSDGMQMIGVQFASASAHHGNYVCTRPDHPAEIRAPVGTLASVAGFQVRFSKQPIHTPGDALNALIAMNPAAVQANLRDLEPGGIVIANADAFTPEECIKAGYAANPLQDDTLKAYRVIAAPVCHLNREAVARVNLSPREAERCRSFFALGIVFWLYDRPLEPTLRWIRDAYSKNPAMIEATTRTLKAGFHFGETCGPSMTRYRVAKVALPAGRYRQINGIEAIALGLLNAAELAKLPLVFAGFPMAPASDVLHRLFEWKQANATIVQAEDDIAAVNLVLGASFGGALGATVVSGPGLSLQSETLGLAVMSELPCVVIDVQRAGPSMGMPAKTEQADLLQALYGRHGECPLIVLAPATPADCYAMVIEAARLAIRYMTPVLVLADVFLAQSAETWRVPDLKELPAIDVMQAAPREPFLPYQRDAHLARPWAVPGTPGLEHRTGGQEKEEGTGSVSYDPLNHERMVATRAKKIAGVVEAIPPLTVEGPASGDLLVLGWGSTCGAITTAAARSRAKGKAVANAHLRNLLPLPRNIGDVLQAYRKVLIPELNAGQLAQVLRSIADTEIVSLTKLQGRPFAVSEIEGKIETLMG
jgi:2-oxoglutarate ferredoxin oxidoreductase subunit alpha